MVSSQNNFNTKLSHYEQLVGKNLAHTRPWPQGLAWACKALGQATSPLRPYLLAWLGLAYIGLALRASGLQAGPEHHYGQPMNRHLNHCEKVDGQSGMAIQGRFNDENRS